MPVLRYTATPPFISRFNCSGRSEGVVVQGMVMYVHYGCGASIEGSSAGPADTPVSYRLGPHPCTPRRNLNEYLIIKV
eukprot:767548-Hanusia_phi.AAC.12